MVDYVSGFSSDNTSHSIFSSSSTFCNFGLTSERALLAIRKIEDAKVGPVGFNFIGYVYHALGDLDSFFEYMNKALEAHALTPSTMMYSPLFARARVDPRYLELMGKIRRQLGLTK